jgi:hypothetical protein
VHNFARLVLHRICARRAGSSNDSFNFGTGRRSSRSIHSTASFGSGGKYGAGMLYARHVSSSVAFVFE